MPELFNVHGFGPSAPFTGHAACSRVDHGVSGHRPATSIAILRLAFATAPVLTHLSLAANLYSPVHYAKGTPSPIAHCWAIGLRPLVSAWFQVLLTQLMAVLFIVQSPYLFTIGHRGVFSLARWSGPLRTEFHELRATLESTC
jgi:hypothetical protein